jgi:plasmid stabilization system protein ParE
VKAVFLTEAEADIKELRFYIIKRFGANTWRETLQAIKGAVHDTISFPLRGCIPDELTELGLTQYRQVLAGKNRIIYEVRDDILYIHIVCDIRKDLRTLLARRVLRS